MVTSVYGGKPYTQHNDGKNDIVYLLPFCFNAVIQNNEHKRSMHGGHGCKHVGALTIHTRKYACSQIRIKPGQTTCITRCMCYKIKTMLHNIPGWGCGINIITNKTQNIYQEKRK